MEIITNILNTIISNFDFTYMFMINFVTYNIIKIIDEFNGNKKVKTWNKRLVLVISIICVTIIYKLTGYDNNLILINSAILSPVFYSWILKPILIKFNIGYKQFDKYL